MVNVKQFTAFTNGPSTFIYGLGDDNKVYFWNYGTETWSFFGKSTEITPQESAAA